MAARTVFLSLPALLFVAFTWSCDGGDGDASTDASTDADTDAGCAGDGVWYDDATGLCWQDPPSVGTMNWYRASGTHDETLNPDAEDYCGDLVHGGREDWRLPGIDELISLIRGCVDGTVTGDLAPSACAMTPAGCAATDTCDGVSDCGGCSSLDGSGAEGYYWDPALGGAYVDWICWHWSSSSRAGCTYTAWVVAFNVGTVSYDGKPGDGHARCVSEGLDP